MGHLQAHLCPGGSPGGDLRRTLRIPGRTVRRIPGRRRTLRCNGLLHPGRPHRGRGIRGGVLPPHLHPLRLHRRPRGLGVHGQGRLCHGQGHASHGAPRQELHSHAHGLRVQRAVHDGHPDPRTAPGQDDHPAHPPLHELLGPAAGVRSLLRRLLRPSRRNGRLLPLHPGDRGGRRGCQDTGEYPLQGRIVPARHGAAPLPHPLGGHGVPARLGAGIPLPAEGGNLHPPLGGGRVGPGEPSMGSGVRFRRKPGGEHRKSARPAVPTCRFRILAGRGGALLRLPGQGSGGGNLRRPAGRR